MIEMLSGLSGILKLVVPLAILGFGVLTTWGIIKWGKRLSEAISEIFKNPTYVVMTIIVIAVLLWIWFDKVQPLLP